MKIKEEGVVSCGLMDSGIAQICSHSGYQVVVSEINDKRLNKGLVAISSFLTKSVEKGKIPQQDRDSTPGRIKDTINIKYPQGNNPLGLIAIPKSTKDVTESFFE